MKTRLTAVAAILAVTVLSVGAAGAQTPAPTQTTLKQDSIDLATLMPPDTIAYLESGSLGRQVDTAIGMLEGTPFADPLVAVQPNTGGGPGPQQILGAVLNPAMLDQVTKVRGWAIGFQGLAQTDRGPEPNVVSVLDLGPGNGLRPAVTMGIMMAGVPAGRIEGMDVIRVNDPAGGGIAYDDRMVVYARPYEQLEWCVQQHQSAGGSPSLATANAAFARFDRELRSTSALAFWMDTGRLLQTLQQASGPGGEGLKAFVAGLRAAGVQDITCRAVFDPQNPFVEAVANLDPEHPSQMNGFALTGPLGRDVLRGIPPAAIALIAGGVTEAQTASLTVQLPFGAATNPLAGAEKVAVFALPPDPHVAAFGDIAAAISGSLGVVVTAQPGGNAADLLESVRAFADLAMVEAGAPIYTMDTEDGMVEIVLPTESPVQGIYLGHGDGFVVASLSPDVVRASLEAGRSGHSALTAGPLHEPLNGLEPEVSTVVLASAGDLVAAATALTEATKPDDEELTQLLGDLQQLLQATRLQVTSSEFPARVAIRAGAVAVPSLADALPILTALGRYEAPVAPVEAVEVAKSITPIRVDGQADDWAGVEPLPWTEGTDAIGQARVVWRDDGLYGLVTSFDPAIEVNDGQPWTNDGLQVFIEVDNARRRGHSPHSRGLLLWPTPQTGPGAASTIVEVHGGAGLRDAGMDEGYGVDCHWAETDDGYAIEFYVPASLLAAQSMVPGSEIGLCLLLRNGSIAPAASFCAEEGSDTWRRPDMWGAIRLSAG